MVIQPPGADVEPGSSTATVHTPFDPRRDKGHRHDDHRHATREDGTLRLNTRVATLADARRGADRDPVRSAGAAPGRRRAGGRRRSAGASSSTDPRDPSMRRAPVDLLRSDFILLWIMARIGRRSRWQPRRDIWTARPDVGAFSVCRLTCDPGSTDTAARREPRRVFMLSGEVHDITRRRSAAPAGHAGLFATALSVGRLRALPARRAARLVRRLRFPAAVAASRREPRARRSRARVGHDAADPVLLTKCPRRRSGRRLHGRRRDDPSAIGMRVLTNRVCDGGRRRNAHRATRFMTRLVI